MRNHRSLLKSGWEAISVANGKQPLPIRKCGQPAAISALLSRKEVTAYRATMITE